MSKNSQHTISVINGDGELEKTYNFLLKKNSRYYNLFSFKMMKDGSLILFHKGNESSKMWSGNLIASRKGERTVKYKDFPVEEVVKSDNVGKTTFHTSGVINSSSGRIVRDSLRTMDMTQPLCTIVNRHVDFMTALEPKENRTNSSIFFEFDPDLDAYLQARIFLSPEKENIIDKYYQQSTMSSINIKFQGDSIEHSGKILYAQVLLEAGPKIDPSHKNDKDLTLILHLQDHIVPSHLRPKK